MTTGRTKLHLLASENDLACVIADPSGVLYAVLQVLRRGDTYSEADFQAMIEAGRQLRLGQQGMLQHAQDEQARTTPRKPPSRASGRHRPPPPLQAPPAPLPQEAVRYAGTEEEEARMAEAQRVQAQTTWDEQGERDAPPPDEEDDEIVDIEYEEDDEEAEDDEPAAPPDDHPLVIEHGTPPAEKAPAPTTVPVVGRERDASGRYLPAGSKE